MVEHAVWVDEVFRIEYSAAVVALVSPGGNVMAVWAFALYESIGEEALVILTIREDDVLLEDVSVLI